MFNDAKVHQFKYYENKADLRLDPSCPVIVRLDGCGFQSWTRCLDHPYDGRLVILMERTMLRLARKLGALYAYTQSDEITLLYLKSEGAQMPFGGRVQKLSSVLASLAGASFNGDLPTFGVHSKVPAIFDCRTYSVPTQEFAKDVILWREEDAIRNSVRSYGQEVLGMTAVLRKGTREIRAELRAEGSAWEDLEPVRKWGSGYIRRQVERRYWAFEIEKLPPHHAARKDPSLTFKRWEYTHVPLPLRWTVANPVGFLFQGDEPIGFGNAVE